MNVFIVLLASAVLGFFLGEVINYLSDVLPRTRAFSKPVCPRCENNRPWMDYLGMRKCSVCGKRPSRRFLIVPILSAVVVGYLGIYPPHHLNFWLGLICFVYLAVVAIIDMEHRVILNEMAIVGVFLGLITGISIHGVVPTLIGGAAGFGIMLGLYFLGEGFAHYMTKKRGLDQNEVALGFGDVNLGGILGLMLGWPVILACLLFAILIGGLISAGMVIWMLVRKDYKPFTAIPYAPFLIFSCAVLLYLLK
jgi:leader peptidase (prepilin peptidase)/N-methyltransferase